MKKHLLTLSMIGISVIAFGQTKKEMQEKIKDGYETSIGWKIKEGDALQLGKGTMPNHNFSYVYRSPSNALKMLGGTSNHETSDDSYARVNLTPNQAKTANIKSFFLEGSKRGGYTVMCKVGVGDMSNYWLDIENAIQNGEITVPAEYASKIKSTNGTQVALSSADELKKYKDLLDSGAINQGEYDAKKKQILGL